MTGIVLYSRYLLLHKLLCDRHKSLGFLHEAFGFTARSRVFQALQRESNRGKHQVSECDRVLRSSVQSSNVVWLRSTPRARGVTQSSLACYS